MENPSFAGLPNPEYFVIPILPVFSRKAKLLRNYFGILAFNVSQN